MQLLTFLALGGLAVASAVAVFVVDSMARATYALAVSFVAAGAELFLLDLHYLAIITILMMLMEMAIMAVFMIMFMMNPAGLMPMSMVHNKRGALGIAGAAFLVLAAGALTVPWPSDPPARAADLTRSLGEGIMGPKMLVMVGVSAALFATIIAALTLATSHGRYDAPPGGHERAVPSNDPPVEPSEVRAGNETRPHAGSQQAVAAPSAADGRHGVNERHGSHGQDRS